MDMKSRCGMMPCVMHTPKAFRRLPLPYKLTIAALVLLGPALVLGVFMELGARYDLLIGQTELSGIRYLRPAFSLLDAIGDHQSYHLQHPDAPSNDLSPPSQNVIQSIQAVETAVQAETATLRDSPSFLAEDAHRMDPIHLWKAWEEVENAPTPQHYDAFMSTLLEAISAVSDCANLALDPALDSHALATATALTLPRVSRELSLLEQAALEYPGVGRSPAFRQSARDRIMQRLGLLRMGLLEEVGTHSQRAIMEDSNFYDHTPGLHRNYAPALKRFLAAADITDETMLLLCHGQQRPEEAARSVTATRDALTALALTGLTELDTMVRHRIRSYHSWRLAGLGSGALALLLALVVMAAISHDMTRSVRLGLNYVRRVAGGDYSAEVDDRDLSRDLAQYTQGVRQMVTVLKQQFGFMDGVLRNMTVPCLIVDKDERLAFVNKPYLDLFEMDSPESQYLGQSFNDFFYDGKASNTILGEVMRRKKERHNLLMSLLSVHGRPLTIRYDASPLYDLDGNIIGGFALFLDFTEIHEQQIEIERLAAFPRENPNPLFSMDAAGKALYQNPAAKTALEELHIEREELLPPNHVDIVHTVLNTRSSRLDVESRPGDRIYSWAYHPVPDQEQVYVYGMDITLRRRMEEQLTHDALHDGLTGLPNRSLLQDRMEQALGRAGRTASQSLALLFLDLDRFKNINDSLGHAAGDDLLLHFTDRLRGVLPGDATLARLGGDEFTILLEGVAGPEQALAFAENIHRAMAAPFRVKGHDLFVTVSIGIVMESESLSDAQELLRNADTAMYRAKSAGRARSELYDEAMHNEARERLSLEMDMQHGLDRDEFEPYYQPLVDIETGRLHGFEALARWNHPTRGLVSPGVFIPIAEESGLIAALGQQMLFRSLRQLAQWLALSDNTAPLSMSVNLSPEQISRPGILQELEQALHETGVNPELIKIEITESGVINNPQCALRMLKDISKLGVRLAVDDFGTGYSSLSHLSRFPFDCIKIDQSFVRGMLNNTRDMEIVRSIVALAHGLDKRIIAEGIEEISQLRELQRLGCHLGQGFLFSPPVPANKARDFVQNNPTWY
ncbi:diguanylate cyclase (GGDEF) domain-containing protein [Paucidesulfovibrio gracilis DSM 16080]|uniref:Diguanylate cyclase (GGDEF) domain-containing protein n=2 Tax=Paucidesulfovibrio TaxID=2910985 RepID=A0A1T4W158_9BACT|nr:diguanylate cyclase (GGDEF) domain-containing protein [Paucidesulfovibrio gracilis DSM 16080]